MFKAVYKFIYFTVIFSFLCIFLLRFQRLEISDQKYLYEARIDSFALETRITNKTIKPLTATNNTSVITAQKYKTIDFVNFPVSKENSLGDYEPDDLIVLNSTLTTRKIFVSKLIIPDLEKLIMDAKKDGINLKVVSGYRSFSDQKFTFDNYVIQERKSNPNYTQEQAIAKANTYSAKPGHSEHQLGTTIDILSDETNYLFNSDPNTKFAKWLEANAQKYNFTISYPQNNPEYIYEPWHLRWRN